MVGEVELGHAGTASASPAAAIRSTSDTTQVLGSVRRVAPPTGRRSRGARDVTGAARSVARILSQVRVGDQLVRRERIQIPGRGGRYTGRVRAVRVLALPRPQVRAPREQAVADQISSAVGAYLWAW